MARSRNSSIGSSDIWPGFVDALATLLLVIIFLLVVFVLAQILLSQAITGKDEALDRLGRQVSELTDLLDLERQANADLRLNIAQLSLSLQETVAARDELTAQLGQAQSRAQDAESALAALQNNVGSKNDQIERRLLEIESLRRDVTTLRKLRDELEARVAGLADAVKQKDDSLATKESELGALRDRSKALEASLASAEERTLLAQRDVEQRDIQLSELLDDYTRLKEDYDAERELSTEQKAQVGLLNQQILALRQEIQKLNAALEAAEAEDRKSQAVIADLGTRLNRALAAKVGELQRYRSEFFGRLREVLGNRPGIRIVGDRFVFQSEVLFASGSAELGVDGRGQMLQLARTLLDISRDIPADVSWVLRVDGHTDTRPINTPQFPSNWELSSARAISVVKFLIGEGVPPSRLAATGFGEFQPIDERTDEIGNLRNRRIELKLTER